MNQRAKRTEDDKIGMAPIKAQFGEATYEIKPLRIGAQRAWRERVTEHLKGIVDGFDQPLQSGGMSQGLTTALLRFPEKMLELLFEYSPELPQEKIIEEATEEQVAVAFSQLMEVAYPFLTALAQVTMAVKAASR